MSNNNKPITVKCAECGTEFTVPTYHYRRYTKSGKSFYCKECYKKHRSAMSKNYWSNLDESSKNEIIEKYSNSRRNNSNEKKELFRKKIQATWDNKSEEEKRAYADQCRANSTKFWESLTNEEYQKLVGHMADAQRNYFANLSDSDKERRANILREASLKYWESLDDETRADKLMSISKHSKDVWANATDEQKANRIAKIRRRRNEYWSNMSEEDRIKFGERHHEWWQSLLAEERASILGPLHAGYIEWYNNLSPAERSKLSEYKSKYRKQYWDSLSTEEKDELIKRQNEGYQRYYDNLKFITEPNKNESAFCNILNMHHIDFVYQYQNQLVYPNFHKLFPNNDELGIKYVSPYHKWDFMVMTNTCNVLIDIDGSVHNQEYGKYERVWKINKNGKLVDVKKLTEFYDSQRKYKTDGLEAYAVLCYDNNITDDTLVMNISRNENMPLKSFIAYLQWLNMTDKEKTEIVKCTKFMFNDYPERE